jgi:hypothetical protein
VNSQRQLREPGRREARRIDGVSWTDVQGPQHSVSSLSSTQSELDAKAGKWLNRAILDTSHNLD